MTASVGSVAGRLQMLLEELARTIPGLESAAIGDANGLPLVSLLRGTKTLAATAMATMALSAAQNVTANLGIAGRADVIIDGPDRKVFVRALDFGLTFIGVFRGEVDVGAAKPSIGKFQGDVRAAVEGLALDSHPRTSRSA